MNFHLLINIIKIPFRIIKRVVAFVTRRIQSIENRIFTFSRGTDNLETIHLYLHTPYAHLTTENFPEKAQKSFNEYNKSEYVEYLYVYKKPCIIEPEYGWLVLPHHIVLQESFSYSEDFKVPLYSNYKKALQKKVYIDTVINLRYYFQNYWHFVHDVCGQITFLDNLGIDVSIPVLVPHNVLNIPFIKEIFAIHPQLRRRTWIMHEYNTVIVAKEVYLPRQMRHERKYFDAFLDAIQFAIPISNKPNKLFVTRSKKRWRALINNDEIEKIALDNGYTIIDSEELSVVEQFEIFSRATHVIGIHGAGLTNCIFRRGQHLRITEIFPSDGIPPHYYWLAHEYGFDYDVLVGGDSDENKHFYLQPEKLLFSINK